MEDSPPNASPEFDAIVIGGGIHGVGAAQAFAAAGYKVALLEQHSLAHGTSSRSSKLIHGGLRYLESFQFRLVYESLQERRRLLRNAPDLVSLKKFFIPVYKSTSRPPWLVRLGLSLYALLTGLQGEALFHKIPRRRWSALHGLKQENLLKVYQYWDAATDDKKLTEAVMHSAQQLGAKLFMPARVQALHRQQTHWVVDFVEDGLVQTLTSRVVVNATGPWINRLLHDSLAQVSSLAIDCVQGSHIVLDEPWGAHYFYVEAPQDQRAVFIMPWYGKLMVGTTERIYNEDPEQVSPSAEEQGYLLDTLKHYFPQYADLQLSSIQESFAGLRVLPKADEKAFSRPRDTRLWQDPQWPGLLSIYGGKLTAYRATSEKIVRSLKGYLPPRRARADTRHLRI